MMFSETELFGEDVVITRTTKINELIKLTKINSIGSFYSPLVIGAFIISQLFFIVGDVLFACIWIGLAIISWLIMNRRINKIKKGGNK